MTREIELTQGKVAVVDDEDHDLLMTGPRWRAQRDWSVKNRESWYALRTVCAPDDGRETSQMMHVFIMGTKPIDHINGDGLDNRRENLRPVTPGQNMQNRIKSGKSASKYKGVYWEKEYLRKDTGKVRPGRWRAGITVDGKTIKLGYRFKTEVEAAKAYDEAARKHFGEFARVNFPREGERGALPLEEGN